MRLLTWNVRGLNIPNKWSLIRLHIVECQEDLVLMQETKIGEQDLVKFGKNLKMWKWASVGVEGASGGLLTIWRPQTILVEDIETSRH